MTNILNRLAHVLASVLLLGSLALLLVATSACNESSAEAAEDPSPLEVLSFNIRYNTQNDGIHAWPNRAVRVAALIRFFRADIVGVQEALKGQIVDLEGLLPGYMWIGVGRDDGAEAGEFSPIFYRADRLRLVDRGTFWLSETPDVPGSLSWDAAITRVATWAVFEERASGRQFYHLNTHFDHMGTQARTESARLIRTHLDSLEAPYAELPIVVTGDFNFTPDAEGYQRLTASPNGLKDTRLAKEPYGPEGTFSGFEVQPEPLTRRIDYVFSRGGWTVERHATLTDQEAGRYPSDHLPVLATLAWPEMP